MLSIKKVDTLFAVQSLTWSRENTRNGLPTFIIRVFSIKCEPLYKVNNLLRYKTIIGTFKKCL